ATDLVLTVTQMLREHGVVGKFVEFFGPGLERMPLANRATIANMAPEYGATCGFFPVDERTMEYMHLSGRDQKVIDRVEASCRAQGFWRDESQTPTYTDTLSLDMSTVEPSLAGPKRPQDRIELSGMKSQWEQDLCNTFGKDSPAADSTAESMQAEGGTPSGGAAVAEKADPGLAGVDVTYDDQTFKLKHGAVVIAAITSCTNTSNPQVMLGAGLVARKAKELGLQRKPWVKTSLAPGSKVVTEYLEKAELLDDLEALGFYLVGYGCTTCIGNSGPLPDPISAAINEHDLVATSVLSGNRNFEGRIGPDIKANYLASPPLVVAYAIAGTVDIDLTREPIGTDSDGNDVFLKDIWPSQQEVLDAVESAVSREQFLEKYANVFEGSDEWKAIDAASGDRYDWSEESTYIQEPPFFVDMGPDPDPIKPIKGARVLAKLGDSVTTDHISPAGSIPADGPAGKYLQRHKVPVSMFNSFGSRRGNHEVMMRGTFANVRVRNELAPGTEGGYTTYYGPDTEANPDDTFAPDEAVSQGEVTSIYDAACGYQQNGIPLVVLAGKDYGMGSSRDWAAKGTYLLGVHAVIATSYERIHRSNLIGMGVLPLQFAEGESADTLGLDGTETFEVEVDDDLQPRQEVTVTATPKDGEPITFQTVARVDTEVEVDYYRNGGILHTVLRRMAAE
ncbi:MAG: aconitate hydratase, partial [Phycisphaeraceae bacterium]|nr:aconitate hydratase [Phycisphaeraceae bacterium]